MPECRSSEYGAVIFAERGHARHYGVSLGNGRVIHYAGNGDASDAVVYEAGMEDFLQGETSYFVCDFPKDFHVPEEDRRAIRFDFYPPSISNVIRTWLRQYRTDRYHLYPPEETVKRARCWLGEGRRSLPLNDCEHFAIWCKTNLSEAGQVERLLELADCRRIRL